MKTKANSTFKLKKVLPCSYEDMTSIRRDSRKICKLVSDTLFEQILSEFWFESNALIRQLTKNDLQIFKLKENINYIEWNKFSKLKLNKTLTEKLYQNLSFLFLYYQPNIQQLTYIDLYKKFNNHGE